MTATKTNQQTTKGNIMKTHPELVVRVEQTRAYWIIVARATTRTGLSNCHFTTLDVKPTHPEAIASAKQIKATGVTL